MPQKIDFEKTCIYTGNSMRRVFVPGDFLEVKVIPFEEFRPGDIVAFFPNGVGKPGIVHRIISRTEDELVTMGDNNPHPDEHCVVKADMPKLVISRNPIKGKIRRIHRGNVGLVIFRINRLRRFIRRCLSFIKRKVLGLLG